MFDSLFGYGQDTEALGEETVLRQSRIPVPSLFVDYTQRIPQPTPTIPKRRLGSKRRTQNKHTNNNTKTRQIETFLRLLKACGKES
jgi:hypothetical protein